MGFYPFPVIYNRNKRGNYMYAVETKSLVKNYGNSTALDSISLQIEQGEIYGFLGPNGAGKSTTMMILTTLLKPTSGSAFVLGNNVLTDARKVRSSIGCVQQDTVALMNFLLGEKTYTCRLGSATYLRGMQTGA